MRARDNPLTVLLSLLLVVWPRSSTRLVSGLQRPFDPVSRAAIDWIEEVEDGVSNAVSSSYHLHQPRPQLSVCEGEPDDARILDDNDDCDKEAEDELLFYSSAATPQQQRRDVLLQHDDQKKIFPSPQQRPRAHHSQLDTTTTTHPHPPFLKTGTTIVGIATDTVVVLAADTRATAGPHVADRATRKLHLLSETAAAAGAGTAADLEHLTRACAAALRRAQVTRQVGNDNDNDTAAIPLSHVTDSLQTTLYAQHGACQAHLIVGGLEPTEGGAGSSRSWRPALYTLHPHGSRDTVAYAALGSGSMAALAVLEDAYCDTNTAALSEEDAVALAVTAVAAGIRHDMGSGSSVDVVVVRSDGLEVRRGLLPEEVLPAMPAAAEVEEEKTTTVSSSTLLLPKAGTNGFGNREYEIESERVFKKSRETEERELQELWKDVLPPP